MIDVTPDVLRDWPLPDHAEDSDKDARGRVLVVGGCRELPGAVVLAATAALRAGAGKLQVATVASTAIALGVALPEALVCGLDETDDGMIAPDAVAALRSRIARCDTLVLGPGTVECAETTALVGGLLDADAGPVFVLDAAAIGALRHLAVPERHAGRIVITPHAGEMAALLDIARDAVAADPAGIATRTARDLGVIVVLKGGSTHVATPDGQLWRYAGGGIGLGTSGSGDVLAGIVGGLAARGADPAQAAVWGVAVHGEAGVDLAASVGPVGFLARELLGPVPRILLRFGETVSDRTVGCTGSGVR